MGGFFGVSSRDDCITDLFYGTDYHSHHGTRRGGMAVLGRKRFARCIHDITNAQFRSKFEHDIQHLRGPTGIGVISDTEDQPVLVRSHLGDYAIVTVGRINNAQELADKAFASRHTHFAEMSDNEINPTELVSSLINQGKTFVDGIARAQSAIEGSCSMLLLTREGIYAARDRLGRTPVIVGRKAGSTAVTMETCSFPNLGYTTVRDLGPGEVVLVTAKGARTVKPAGKRTQICAFLWVYYGYPASSYEGVNVEEARCRCGEMLAGRCPAKVDMVAGIPDSGTGHAIGYSNAAGIPHGRPFVKYTPTWPRSFMPQDQEQRDLVARMKLIPVAEIIRKKRLLFCEDSIVRGTQLKDTVCRLFRSGAREVHMRPACPPLIYGCKFLNFSRSRSELDLAARTAIQKLEGGRDVDHLKEYADPSSDRHAAMVEEIRKRLGLTSLAYQRLDDLVAAIGLPREKLCTYCWSGEE